MTRFQILGFAAVCSLSLMCVRATAVQSEEQKSSSSKAATSTAHHKKQASASSSVKKRSTHSASKAKASSSRRRKRTARGQQKIDSERAQSIQEALIREHYLTGQPTGTWNQACEDAMRRYQADHGWQTKTVPDSRAIIQLGLGPSKDHLLNPESAMTTGPEAPKAASLTTSSQTSPPAAGPSKTPTADTAVPASKTSTAEPVPASSPQNSSSPQ